MTNLPVTRTIPHPTPQLAQSLSPEQLDAHRASIASDVEVILQGYWDSQPPPNIKAGILADWADTLEDWTGEQVLYGLRKWRNENPNKRPNPGHILSILKLTRGVAEAKRNPPIARAVEIEPRCDPDVAAEILAEAGYTPKKFGGAT